MAKLLNYSIGIYMPTHNRVELLKKAIDSVLKQSYQNFKLVIVNDGSSDGTKEYLDSIDDPRVIALHNEVSIGACKARNRAIEYLDTDLVTGLDDDDTFLPSRLQELLSVYDEKYSFVCSGYYWDYGIHKKALFNKNREISLSDAFDLNQCSNQILVNRERLLSVGCFDAELPALQDHDLWVRLIDRYGNAYRKGKPTYIVNDDRSLERISSVKNKLNAIEIFEKKHAAIMSERNCKNFQFYKSKILKQKMSLKELASSSRFGLKTLKFKYFVTQYLESLTKARLNYLQKGYIGESKVLEYFFSYLIPLIATGGPGASRAILLTLCVILFGTVPSASFSKDLFVVLILNTALCQGFSFYLYREKYFEQFWTITRQSMIGLLLLLPTLYVLNLVSFVDKLNESILMAVCLHFYFLIRTFYLARKKFLFLSVIEIMCFLLCIALPFLTLGSSFEGKLAPYYMYSASLAFVALIMYAFAAGNRDTGKDKLTFSMVKNMSLSNIVGPLSMFSLPAIVGYFSTEETVTIVALCISVCSLIFLAPRAYANKFIPDLGKADFSRSNINVLNRRYTYVAFIGGALGAVVCFGYILLTVSGFSWSKAAFYSIGISLVMFASQLGFVFFTHLSLNGGESKVLKIQLKILVLSILIILTIGGLKNSVSEYVLSFILFVAMAFLFYLRKLMALNVFSKIELRN